MARTAAGFRGTKNGQRFVNGIAAEMDRSLGKNGRPRTSPLTYVHAAVLTEYVESVQGYRGPVRVLAAIANGSNSAASSRQSRKNSKSEELRTQKGVR